MDTLTIVRESVGAIAIICGVIAKWKLGNMDSNGWYWALVGGTFWTIFSCIIGSPVSFINNAIYFVLSVRGLMLWKRQYDERTNRL